MVCPVAKKLELKMSEPGFLTTHILDTARGCPANGVEVKLYRLEGGTRSHLVTMTTNNDGRTDQPILPAGDLSTGVYELVFMMGEYFRGHAPSSPYPFVDTVPIRFGVDDASSHYHVPLLASPFSFSTYRGS